MKHFLTPLLFVLPITEHASAATVLDFSITLESVPEGPSLLGIGDVFLGTLSYSAVIPSTGAFRIDPSTDSGITLSFVFDSHIYTQADDLEFPGFPKLYFNNGTLLGFSFESANKNPTSLPEGFVSIENTNDFFYSYNGNGEYAGKLSWLTPSPVPEPSVVALSASALFYGLRRRRTP